jgi:hypothetical protein
MTDTEEQLALLRERIQICRTKAVKHRTLAEAMDAEADSLVKECAKLGTGELPIFGGTNEAR